MQKSKRLSITVERLNKAPLATIFDEAWQLLHSIMNAVEDEFSGVPYDPCNWKADGRLYPPALDREQHSEFEGVRMFHSLGHKIFIAANGAIMFVSRGNSDEILLDKPGKDGKRCPRI